MTVLAATQTLALGPSWLDPAVIIESLGPWALAGLAAIVFAECGLLLGFFLPGDSLLFTAGLFVAQGAIGVPLWLVCVVLVAAAVAGNAVGYGIGLRAGPAVFDRPRSRLFNPKHVTRTHEFFERFGNRAIVLGRFVPIVRTFITVSAGVARMDARRYLTYSLVGGVAWAAGVTVLGYFLGQFTVVRERIDLILVAIVLISVVPIVFEVLRARASARRGAGVAGAATVAAAGTDVDPAAVTTRMPAVRRPGAGAPGPDAAAPPVPDAAPPAPPHTSGGQPYRPGTTRPSMPPRPPRPPQPPQP
ncbi:DedA family protein [Pseudonocardia kongjuensis]|uniref:DedA family protein n=1 Tax=Pseudonocardia kongjuensis TaxID=102227 RepID=UPI0031D3183C